MKCKIKHFNCPNGTHFGESTDGLNDDFFQSFWKSEIIYHVRVHQCAGADCGIDLCGSMLAVD